MNPTTAGVLFVVSIALTLGAAAVFTNAVEWLGKRLRVSEGVVGSVFAGVGTALPETMIPIVAIFFGDHGDRAAVGIGAILGAPFMLTTLTIPLLAAGVLTFAAMGKREPRFSLPVRMVRLDLRFFLIAFGTAILVAFVGWAPARYIVAAALIVLYVVYLRVLVGMGVSGEADVAPLFLLRRRPVPPYLAIIAQIVLGLGGIIGGAHLFVRAVEMLAQNLGVSPLVLSLLITPVATELPEKLNSLLWVYQRKDGLAVANITGAMVFQSTFPVTAGLIGTSWRLETPALLPAILALLAASILYLSLVRFSRWRPGYVIAVGSLYLLFGVYLYTR